MNNLPINILENLKELFLRIASLLLKSFPVFVIVVTAVLLFIVGILSLIFS